MSNKERMTHEEYCDWCEARGLHIPKKCEKCGGSYHYVCATCNPDFLWELLAIIMQKKNG